MDATGIDERDALLARLLAFQKMHAALHAEEQRMLAELAALPLPACLQSREKQFVIDEIAAVLQLPSRTAADRVATAQDLLERYPATLAALERGEISIEHARALSDEALGVDDATAAKVEARVLDRAAGRPRPGSGSAPAAPSPPSTRAHPRPSPTRARNGVCARGGVRTGWPRSGRCYPPTRPPP